MNSSNNLKNSLLPLYQLLWASLFFLYQGVLARRFMSHLKRLLSLSLQPHYLKNIVNEVDLATPITSKRFQSLQHETQHLHSQLPDDPQFTYSLLIPVYNTKGPFLTQAVQSALNQTGRFEVVIGFDGVQTQEVYAIIEDFQKKQPKLVRSFQFERGGIAKTTNGLAQQAKGNYLVLMDHDDWIRPDLLYHYEIALRVASEPMHTVLYCNEFKIDERDFPIVSQRSHKDPRPHFPYFFINSVCHCLMVSKQMWNKVGGLRKEFDGGQDFDLALRLNVKGATFERIPHYLYAWRSHRDSTAQNVQQKPYAHLSSLKALQEYSQALNLGWKIDDGYLVTTFRGIPSVEKVPVVLVVIHSQQNPVRTEESIRSIHLQMDVRVQVMVLDKSKHLWEILAERNEEHVLFLKSGVVLEKDALIEMFRWITQPKIGVVGCRLHFPNDTLYHGGVNSDLHYEERGHPSHRLCLSKQMRVTHAVSSVCALVNRDQFLQIGEFSLDNEVRMSLKYNEKGFINFYTPFAKGVVLTD